MLSTCPINPVSGASILNLTLVREPNSLRLKGHSAWHDHLVR